MVCHFGSIKIYLSIYLYLYLLTKVIHIAAPNAFIEVWKASNFSQLEAWGSEPAAWPAKKSGILTSQKKWIQCNVGPTIFIRSITTSTTSIITTTLLFLHFREISIW